MKEQNIYAPQRTHCTVYFVFWFVLYMLAPIWSASYNFNAWAYVAKVIVAHATPSVRRTATPTATHNATVSPASVAGLSFSTEKAVFNTNVINKQPTTKQTVQVAMGGCRGWPRCHLPNLSPRGSCQPCLPLPSVWICCQLGTLLGNSPCNLCYTLQGKCAHQVSCIFLARSYW